MKKTYKVDVFTEEGFYQAQVENEYPEAYLDYKPTAHLSISEKESILKDMWTVNLREGYEPDPNAPKFDPSNLSVTVCYKGNCTCGLENNE